MLAVLVSMTTSDGPGHRPLTRLSELNWGREGSTLKPRFGAPPNAIALPFLISCGVPETPPSASRTSGRARTRGSSDCANEGDTAAPPPPPPPEPALPLSIALRPVTVASVPR